MWIGVPPAGLKNRSSDDGRSAQIEIVRHLGGHAVGIGGKSFIGDPQRVDPVKPEGFFPGLARRRAPIQVPADRPAVEVAVVDPARGWLVGFPSLRALGDELGNGPPHGVVAREVDKTPVVGEWGELAAFNQRQKHLRAALDTEDAADRIFRHGMAAIGFKTYEVARLAFFVDPIDIEELLGVGAVSEQLLAQQMASGARQGGDGEPPIRVPEGVGGEIDVHAPR